MNVAVIASDILDEDNIRNSLNGFYLQVWLVSPYLTDLKDCI
jgi:hypothetical protein